MDPAAILTTFAAASGSAALLSGLAATLTRRLIEPSTEEVEAAEASVEVALATVADDQSARNEAQASGSGGVALTPNPVDAEVQRILVDYVEDLYDEAARIAQRASADRPSVAHVRLAADRIGILRQRASVLADIGLAGGGITLGAAAAFGINLLTGGTAADGSTGWAVGVGAAGLTVFVVSATAKWLRR